MKRWADSAQPPTDWQLGQAKAAGYGGWAGYFAGTNILNGWDDSDFQRVRNAGLESLAYCSGWSDPTECEARAAGLGILVALDNEPTIRPDGDWVQAWLDTAQAGLYGNGPVHRGRSAAFHIAAGQPGYDPSATWPDSQQWQAFGWGPYVTVPGVCGWQWAGTHAMWGVEIDSSWFDDALHGGGGGAIFQEDASMILVETNGTAYITDLIYKRLLDASGLVIWSALGVPKHENIDPGFIASIPDAPTSAGGAEPPEPKTVEGTFTGTLS